MELNDYAMPTMQAEKALKQVHWAFLDKRMGDAEAYALEAMLHCAKIVEALRQQERG